MAGLWLEPLFGWTSCLESSFDRDGVGSSPLAVELLHVADSVEAVVAPRAGRVDFSAARPGELVALLPLVGAVLNQLMLVLLCLLHECERRGVAQGMSGVQRSEDWLARALRMDLPRARVLVRQALALHAASAARSLSQAEPAPCARAAGMAAGFVSFEQAHRIGITLKALATYDGASREALEFAEHTMVALCQAGVPAGPGGARRPAARGPRPRTGPAPDRRSFPAAGPVRALVPPARPHGRTDGALLEIRGLATLDMAARLKPVLEPLAAPLGTAELPDPRNAKQRLLDALMETVTVAGRILPGQQNTAAAAENDDDDDGDVGPIDLVAAGSDATTGQPAGQQALDLGLALDGVPSVPAVATDRLRSRDHPRRPGGESRPIDVGRATCAPSDSRGSHRFAAVSGSEASSLPCGPGLAAGSGQAQTQAGRSRRTTQDRAADRRGRADDGDAGAGAGDGGV